MKLLSKFAVASAVCSFGLVANAADIDDTLTNIVTVNEACDVVAIGLDFGVTSSPVPAAGVTATGVAAFSNSGAGFNALQSTGHPGAGADENETLDLNLLGVNVPVPLTGVSGVFVFCTSTPNSITLSGDNVGTFSNGTGQLPTDLGSTEALVVTSAMEDAEDPVANTDTLAYTFSFDAPVALGLPGDFPAALPAPFIGSYLITSATITGGQAATPGFYQDVVTATVNY